MSEVKATLDGIEVRVVVSEYDMADEGEGEFVEVEFFIDSPKRRGVDERAYSAVFRRPEPPVETTYYVLTAPLRHSAFVNRDADLEAVVEAIRGYAFPDVWGYQRVERGSKEFEGIRVEFSIEATERTTREYMDEIRDALLSTIVTDDYIISDITATKKEGKHGEA